MPKFRIYDEDGKFRGGLFNTDVHNILNSRMWTGTPRPHYSERLFDISEGEWILLRLSDEPRVTGSREYDNEFDEASHATRLCDETAHGWFLRNEMSPPPDLLARMASTTDARRGGTIGLADGKEATPAAQAEERTVDKAVRAQPPSEQPCDADSPAKGRGRADRKLDKRVREQLKAGGRGQTSVEIAELLNRTPDEVARSRSRIRAADSRRRKKRRLRT